MARPISTHSNSETGAKCVRCGHLEGEHGTTGTKPCLAIVGNLLNSDFCSCDEFQRKAVKPAKAA